MIIVHRDYAGEHEQSESCWCDPVIVGDDDDRTSDEIVEAATARPS